LKYKRTKLESKIIHRNINELAKYELDHGSFQQQAYSALNYTCSSTSIPALLASHKQKHPFKFLVHIHSLIMTQFLVTSGPPTCIPGALGRE
jgi:hypothetical protein